VLTNPPIKFDLPFRGLYQYSLGKKIKEKSKKNKGKGDKETK